MSLTLQTGSFDAFFQAPFDAYGADSLYVSPFKSDLKRFLSLDQNPLFQGDSLLTYFTAHEGDRVVGRITAHIHAEANATHGLKWGYFGYFDCADHPNAAKALLEAAENWCRDKGMTQIAGNFNLTAMQQIGVMTNGFETAPFLDQIYNPAHIPKLLRANGYTQTFPMTTFGVDLSETPASPLGPKQQAILDDPEFQFAPINRRTIPQRMEDARQILNASFADNPMFVPVTREEFQFQAKDMKWIMDPRISTVLHYSGEPAGCIICVPDMNPLLQKIRSRFSPVAPLHFLRHRWTNKRAILIFIGVIPELQKRGVNPVMLRRTLVALKSAGYDVLGNTWIADENGASLAQKERAGASALHRLHLFEKEL